MNPNYPGGDPSYPGNPNPENPPTYPQQPPPAYGQQPGVPPQPDYSQQPPPYQPPVYNQAPPPQYGQYGQPQYPQQQPQPPQQKKSNKGWIIGCGIAAAVLLLVCGGVGVALYIAAQKATDTVKSAGNQATIVAEVGLFCTAYMAQDYGSAYQLLSSAEQGHISQSNFAAQEEALDSSVGQVTTCTIDPNHALPSVSSDGKTATVQMQVARGENANLATGNVKLIYENDQWKIDSADAALKLL